MQHVEKIRKVHKVNMEMKEVEEYFDYWFLKLINNNIIKGQIPQFIIKNDIASNFLNILEVKIKDENISKELEDTKSQQSSDISENINEIKVYDKWYEKYKIVENNKMDC